MGGREVTIDEEGFMTDPTQWTEELADVLAKQIDITLTDAHWTVLRFLREDFESEGETATLRRISTQIGVPTKELFSLFPKKPGKKMAYVAGLPKPKGCI
jgi:tRNA 2-thiouridine synthesizing protein E